MGGRQLAALIEGGADHPGHSFLGPQWPPNLGGLSWRWLCRLKGASSEKAGIFVSAFQSVAMPQKLPFLDLAVLPAGVSAPRWDAGDAAGRRCVRRASRRPAQPVSAGARKVSARAWCTGSKLR